MASSTMILLALLSTFVVSINADGFLSPSGADQVQLQDVEQIFFSEVEGADASRLSSIEDEMRSMFLALPKNKQGNLAFSTTRYALHRYFVQQYGWYMRGLQPSGAAWNSSSTAVAKAEVPSYVQNLIEQRLHGDGMGLHDLAVFALTLQDLVSNEVVGFMERIFESLDLPRVGPVPRIQSEQAIQSFLVTYLLEINMTVTQDQMNNMEKELREAYPAWDDTVMWVQDLWHAHDRAQQSKRNPFLEHHESFFDANDFAQEVGHNFGSFQRLECHSLKGKLVDLEHKGSGRVRLSQFYAGGLKGDWTFSESVEYLRNLGVLDETDPSKPSVVIANYLNSQTNCLITTGFYAVCCADECEGLMQHLEVAVGTPSVRPDVIAGLISNLHSDTVDAPRNLSSVLLGRLNDIAEYHGGEVPLHGRLFAQWMHHAYPRECPFPHVSGTTNPMSPDHWMDLHGVDSLEATEDEMRVLHHAESGEDGDADISLPWTAVEELVASHHDRIEEKTSSSSPLLRTIMATAAVGSFAFPLLKATQVAMNPGPGMGKSEKCLV